MIGSNLKSKQTFKKQLKNVILLESKLNGFSFLSNY